jgi:multiple antibiotic resistance protein
MNDALTFSLLCLTSFFTLINPLGAMPVFITLTGNLTPAQRNKTARKACVVSLLTLVLFALSGQLLFRFFNISVDSFRIVGGVIFFIMGMDMLQARLERVKVSDEDVHTYVDDISITPLAIPMICGPGALTNAIVLMEDATTFSHKVVLFAAMTAIIVLTYVILRSANHIIDCLGETGNKVLMRLMGLIVMVIAVEFIFAGLKPPLIALLNAAHP